jgi:hypothetical protein
MTAPPDSGLATLSFETGATPQAVLDYYDAWLVAHGWASQRYSQAQTQGTWQFAAYVKDGSPEVARMRLRGFRGMVPLVYIPSSHARLYINAHPLRDATLVEILTYSIEY